MSVELDRDQLLKYRELANNPIYYYNAIQYTAGSFYRAVLGYEILWDKRKEAELMLCLDYYLTHLSDEGSYYGETLKTTRDVMVWGIPWTRAVAPRNLSSFKLEWPFELQRGEVLQTRINLLDKPYHVDVERPSGEVFTISYPRYQNFKDQHCKLIRGRRKNDRQKQSKELSNPKGEKLSLVKRLSQKQRLSTLFNALSLMRQIR